MCSLSPSCYYLIDRLLLQLVVRGLFDGSDITDLRISVLRTPSFDIDQLFGNGSRSKTLPTNVDNLIVSTPSGVQPQSLMLAVC